METSLGPRGVWVIFSQGRGSGCCGEGDEMEDKIRRFAPIAGIAFIVLVLVGFAVEGSTPSVDDPAGEIMQSYVDNDTNVIVASALSALGAAALVLFAADLSARMRDAGSRLLASVAFGGAIVSAAGVGVDAALRFVLADSAGKISPEGFQGLFAAWNGFFWPIHLGIALLVVSASLAAIDSKVLPVALSGLGIVAAVLLVIPVLAVTLIGLAGAAIWILITSILALRQPRTASA